MDRTSQPSLLQSTVAPAFWGAVIFGLAVALAVGQLMRSNQPHELTLAPLVTLIQLAAVWLLGLAVLRVVRALGQPEKFPCRLRLWLGLCVLVPLATASLIFLAGAASIALDILFP